MGLDVDRFEGSVDENFLCPICLGVLENPVQTPVCEHIFCSSCLNEWLNHNATCPLDHIELDVAKLRVIPRILRNFLNCLTIRCNNVEKGCNAVVKLDGLHSHLEKCEYAPEKLMCSSQGSCLMTPTDKPESHNCVVKSKNIMKWYQQKIVGIEKQITETKMHLDGQLQQLSYYKARVRVIEDSVLTVDSPNFVMGIIADQSQFNQVARPTHITSLAELEKLRIFKARWAYL